MNTAFSNGLDFGQVLADTLTGDANFRYDLSVWIGHRSELLGPLPSYTVRLLAGTTVLNSVTSPFDPALGKFGQVNLSYLTTGLEADIGSALSIELINNGGIQLNYDEVELALNSIPEPSTWALMGGGLLGLAWIRKRRPL